MLVRQVENQTFVMNPNSIAPTERSVAGSLGIRILLQLQGGAVVALWAWLVGSFCRFGVFFGKKLAAKKCKHEQMKHSESEESVSLN